MPTYLYECPVCEHRVELEQAIGDVFRPSCHDCCTGNSDPLPEMVRIIQPTGFVLKGSGWAKDGYSR